MTGARGKVEEHWAKYLRWWSLEERRLAIARDRLDGSLEPAFEGPKVNAQYRIRLPGEVEGSKAEVSFAKGQAVVEMMHERMKTRWP